MLKKYVSSFMVLVFLLTNIQLNLSTMSYSSALINSDAEPTPNSSHALPTPDSASTTNIDSIPVNESLPLPTPIPTNGDHADWAGARLVYLQLPLTNEVFLSNLDYLSASCGWRTVKKDKSVGNNIITLNGMTWHMLQVELMMNINHIVVL